MRWQDRRWGAGVGHHDRGLKVVSETVVHQVLGKLEGLVRVFLGFPGIAHHQGQVGLKSGTRSHLAALDDLLSSEGLVENIDGAFAGGLDPENQLSEARLLHQFAVLRREIVKAEVAVEDDLLVDLPIDHFVAEANEPVASGECPGVVKDVPRTVVGDEVVHLIGQPLWTLGSKLWIGHGPRTERAATVGAVSAGHGPHERQPLLPLLKVQVSVGQVPVDEGKTVEVAQVLVVAGRFRCSRFSVPDAAGERLSLFEVVDQVLGQEVPVATDKSIVRVGLLHRLARVACDVVAHHHTACFRRDLLDVVDQGPVLPDNRALGLKKDELGFEVSKQLLELRPGLVLCMGIAPSDLMAFLLEKTRRIGRDARVEVAGFVEPLELSVLGQHWAALRRLEGRVGDKYTHVCKVPR